MAGQKIQLAQVVTFADVDAALQDVEAACSIETANLLRAVFCGFRLLSDGARLATEIVAGSDEKGQQCLFLVLRFPDLEWGGGKAVSGDGRG